MSNMNPIDHLKHAWGATNSTWGKACIVLFYLYIWLNILQAIHVIATPSGGFDCFYGVLSGYASAGWNMHLRLMNIYLIGFLLYADRGGIRVWNVAMVFFVGLAGKVAIWLQWDAMFQLDGAPEGCNTGFVYPMLEVYFVYELVTLFCSIMEHWSAPSASAGETTTLL